MNLNSRILEMDKKVTELKTIVNGCMGSNEWLYDDYFSEDNILNYNIDENNTSDNRQRDIYKYFVILVNRIYRDTILVGVNQDERFILDFELFMSEIIHNFNNNLGNLISNIDHLIKGIDPTNSHEDICITVPIILNQDEKLYLEIQKFDKNKNLLKLVFSSVYLNESEPSKIEPKAFLLEIGSDITSYTPITYATILNLVEMAESLYKFGMDNSKMIRKLHTLVSNRLVEYEDEINSTPSSESNRSDSPKYLRVSRKYGKCDSESIVVTTYDRINDCETEYFLNFKPLISKPYSYEVTRIERDRFKNRICSNKNYVVVSSEVSIDRSYSDEMFIENNCSDSMSRPEAVALIRKLATESAYKYKDTQFCKYKKNIRVHQVDENGMDTMSSTFTLLEINK